MITTTVSTKGRIVIPSQICQRFKIKTGTRLYIEEKENQIVLQPLTREYFERMAGILNTKGKLTKAILEERIKETKL